MFSVQFLRVAVCNKMCNKYFSKNYQTPKESLGNSITCASHTTQRSYHKPHIVQHACLLENIINQDQRSFSLTKVVLCRIHKQVSFLGQAVNVDAYSSSPLFIFQIAQLLLPLYHRLLEPLALASKSCFSFMSLSKGRLGAVYFDHIHFQLVKQTALSANYTDTISSAPFDNVH